MDYIETYKREYLNQTSQVKSFAQSWDIWLPIILKNLSENPSGKDIFDLGDNLGEIFKSRKVKGRSQGTLSGAGYAWECLVTWYLNFIFWDLPVMVIRANKKYTPKILSKCITVTIANNRMNTESDILIFSVPNPDSIIDKNLKGFNKHLTKSLSEVDLTNLQCKTNWKDNSQIPMLWDLIYNSESKLPYVSVGVEGVSPNSVNNFKYAFATVPTNGEDEMKPTTAAVLRVKNLTGGNYWGQESESDIASSIKELAGRNYPSFFEGGVVKHLDSQLDNNPDMLHEFLSLKW